MAASSNAASINKTLSQWLRLLWAIAPPLHLNSEVPHIAAGSIHLPARRHWHLHMAAAAHAAAHLVHSPRRFDGDGIGAITRALMALLEDARVEALAIRELPGLARLWRPLHNATPALGTDFEALLQRLARCLADPDYDDPDQWVRKGVKLFYPDAQRQSTALLTPADVRKVAMQLGHDIGQMRLQFNVKMYRPAPAYRDDNRWMWTADVLNTAPPPPTVAAGGSRDDDNLPPDVNATITRYPEWDRLISRLRPDWCSVIEQAAPPIAALPPAPVDAAIRPVALALLRPLRALMHSPAAPQCSDEGEIFDPDALVDWSIARRLRNASESRVYRVLDRCEAAAAVFMLIDQSASTSITHHADGRSVLQTAALAASAVSSALHNAGVDCAIAGFSSHGRHAVRLVSVKPFSAPADVLTIARLQALRPGGSTRLGAALRHATRSLAHYRNGPRWVIVFSDGEPHDVDIHDPRYLVEDARQAVMTAGRLGVRVVCLVMAPDRVTSARHIFGRQGVRPVHDIRDVPRALQRLLG